MARPTRIPLVAGQQAWDALVNDDFTLVFDRPFAITLHDGDESDLEATYPAASYDKCFIWVDHSVDGWGLWFSDGATWALFSAGGGGSSILTIESITTTDTISAGTTLAVCSGTSYTVTLPAAATAGAGFVLWVKRTASGNILIDANGAETIDGVANYTLRRLQKAIALVSDGTNWLILTVLTHPLGIESIAGTATIGANTDVAICSGTTYTVTLQPAATVGAGALVTVKRTSSGTITVDADGSETIDGAANFALTVALSSISVLSDGSNWHII